jgi:tetratricopeptide (TPR) repeat protein
MDHGRRWHARLAAGLLLACAPGAAWALPQRPASDPSPLHERGAEVRMALLIDYYRRIPQRKDTEEPQTWAVRMQEALDRYKQEVTARYTEGTLQRLTLTANTEGRRAAVLALGLTGTMTCNKSVALRLHDGDAQVRQLATDALWAIWFRADSPENILELQRVMRLRDADEALEAYAALLKKSPKFAEAYNQRAILHFRMREYQKSIADCETVVKLNPCHFGAHAGMGQCYMKLRKSRNALKAFKSALRINPNMDGVEETIRTLEDALGGEGRRDDKK